MVIAFEGLMRVGKTTTIDALRTRHPGVKVIREVALREPVPGGDAGETAYFIRNDLLKTRLAAAARPETVVLMDRCFLSTTLFQLAWRGVHADGGDGARREAERLFPRIQTPDLLILIHEDPRASWRRSREQLGSRLPAGWRDPEFVERLAAWYDAILSHPAGVFPAKAVHVVPSGPLARTVAAVERILRDHVTVTGSWRRRARRTGRPAATAAGSAG